MIHKLEDFTNWEDMKNKVICGDALELLKRLPDKSIDLVLTDPPYGIDIAKDGTVGGGKLAKVKDYGAKQWDNKIPTAEIFKEIMRVSKFQIIFGGNYFIEHLYNTSCFIVWDKKNTGNFADCELAWTNFTHATKKIEFMWNGMLQENMKNKEQRYHPTQKPRELMQRIINDYAKDVKTILDPFGGSFTTMKACQELGIDCISCELEMDYCRIGERRLAEVPLFSV